MRYKLFYFLFSLLFIIPGLYFLTTSGLKLGIDFTGGTQLEYQFKNSVSSEDIKNTISEAGLNVLQVQNSGTNTYTVKLKYLEQEQISKIKNALSEKYGPIDARREESIGPVIGEELTINSIKALVVASVAIVLYIAFSFRKVPKITSSWRFGIAAIAALLHDVLIVVGFFAFLGKFFNVEIDTMFVTALLTIIGFSVHDTIVVFDRIRENLLKHVGKSFAQVANISILQTMGRSLNTSLTVVFVLLALLLFGGDSIRWFVVALLVGIISGTYSSIFNATALLTFWEEKLGH